MFKDEFAGVCNAGKNKVNLLEKNILGYFTASLLAGMFVAFGSIVAFTLGAGLAAVEYPMVKAVQAFAFTAALSLVIAAGAELFTGNCFVLGAASLNKQVAWSKTIKLWAVCYIGNLVGSVLTALIYQGTGITDGMVGEYYASLAAAKMSLAPGPLFARAVLCNILVCLAVWCSIKMKSEAGKLIMVFWCIFVFITCGFEHSIANMSILTIGMLNANDAAVSLTGFVYNVGVATLGNMVGALLFVSLPYYLIAKEKNKKQ